MKRKFKPADYNPRQISAAQLRALARSMAEFGDLSGIVVNVRTGNLVSGHQRVKKLDSPWEIDTEPFQDEIGTVALGYVVTPRDRWNYREVDWPDEKEKAANLAANKHSGDWDHGKLSAMLEELKAGKFDRELLGFSAEDEKQIVAEMHGPTQRDPAEHGERIGSEKAESAPTKPEPFQYPIMVILSKKEYDKWTRLKSGKSDKDYIKGLLENVAQTILR